MRTSTPLALAFQAATRRNKIINGNFRVNQYLLTYPYLIPAGGAYFIDRWLGFGSVASKFQVTPISNINAGLGFPISQYGLKISSIAGGYNPGVNEFYNVAQRIEGLNIQDLGWPNAGGSPAILSFAAALNSGTGTLGGILKDSAGTYSFGFQVALTSVWKRFNIPITPPPGGTFPITSSLGMTLLFDYAADPGVLAPSTGWNAGSYQGVVGDTQFTIASGITLSITDVMLSGGNQFVPFPQEDFATMLARCQRYFETSYDYGVVPGAVSDVGEANLYFANYSSVSVLSTVSLPIAMRVTKRTDPTITTYSPTTGASGKIRDRQHSTDVTGNVDLIGMNNFRLYGTCSASDTTVQMAAHWTASAEL